MSRMALQARVGIEAGNVSPANGLGAKLPRLDLEQNHRGLERKPIVVGPIVIRTLGKALRKQRDQRPLE